MSNLFKSKFLLGVMVVAVMFVGVVAVATTASADCTVVATVKVGSKGESVKCVQMKVGVAQDGTFGPKTAEAVKAFQTSKGLTADGIVGAKSAAAMNGSAAVGGALCPNGMLLSNNCAAAPVAGGALCPNGMTLASNCSSAESTGPLAGTAGEISDVNKLSQYNNEEVGAGQKDVKVLGVEVQATKEGDIKLKSTKLSFVITNASGSTKLDDYVGSVSVWMGSTKVGSADVADFNKDSTGHYSKTVALSSSSVVRADETVKFYVSVDALSNLDSGDIDSEDATIGMDNIRFEDGSGVVSTDDATGDLAISGVSVRFVSFSTASDTELKINVDSTLEAGIQTVNTTSDTDGITLLKGTMKVDGSSDVWLDEVPFLFTTNATNVDDVTPTVYFTIDGTEYSETMTATAGTTEVITFNDLDKTLTAGKTYTFSVKADVNDVETSLFDEGDYLSAALDATRRASIVAENEDGDQLTDATEMTGVASGTIQYFYSIAPSIKVVSSSLVANDNGSSAPTAATATLKLAVTAQGGTVYLNGDDESTLAKEFITLAVNGGDATASVSSYNFETSGTYTTTNGGADNEYFTLNDGDTMYVTITAVVARGAGGSTSGLLTGLKGTAVLFGTASTDDTSRSVNSLSFTALTDVLKTPQVSLSRTSA